jgi:hypothetical protein
MLKGTPGKRKGTKAGVAEPAGEGLFLGIEGLTADGLLLEFEGDAL